MKRLLTEPLLHFLLLGAVIFAVFEVASPPASDGAGENLAEIVVSQARIDAVTEKFVRTWQRPPSTQELDGLIQDYVREEAAVREAVALGLDRNDNVIRRLLRQRLEFITEDVATLAEPTDAELAAYLHDHAGDFRGEPQVSFSYIFFDPQRRGAALAGDAAQLRARLNAQVDSSHPDSIQLNADKRKEVYATTGPRMVVRFFGGWDFETEDAYNRLPAAMGYAKGVPMGGEMSHAPAGKTPSFLVAALKDPIGANLDRIQIVKGWLDKKGEVHEQVYDVVWGDADKRQPGADGKLPSVGSTVDVAKASWTNTIGDPELITVWRDLEFDPQQRAFYYARVIEIPTPRWTAYDAKYYGLKNVDPSITMITQERAYTSPIWYTPEN